MIRVDITQNSLKKLLKYNPTTGKFTWLVSNRTIKKNMEAGCTRSDGYIRIRINNKKYYAHRLAFLYMLGEIPEQVDHINRQRNDNRWINLRGAIGSQNNINSKLSKKNMSGFKGVSWYQSNKAWNASIGFNGERLRLGFFKTPEEAHDAYRKKALELYGEFAEDDI